MDKSVFTISFLYEIIAAALHIELCAEIEMTSRHSCVVINVRRVNTVESPLLPVMNLEKIEGKWIHAESKKESNIVASIGQAIENHYSRYSEKDNRKKTAN